jgi:hypothetical protein
MFRDFREARELKQELPGLMDEIGQTMAAARADLAAELARPVGAAIPPAVVAKRLAEADAERAALNPSLVEMMRAGIVPMLRQKAEMVRAGVVAVDAPNFDLDLEVEYRRGVITADELAEIRAVAGTPGFGM